MQPSGPPLLSRPGVIPGPCIHSMLYSSRRAKQAPSFDFRGVWFDSFYVSAKEELHIGRIRSEQWRCFNVIYRSVKLHPRRFSHYSLSLVMFCADMPSTAAPVKCLHTQFHLNLFTKLDHILPCNMFWH